MEGGGDEGVKDADEGVTVHMCKKREVIGVIQKGRV